MTSGQQQTGGLEEQEESQNVRTLDEHACHYLIKLSPSRFPGEGDDGIKFQLGRKEAKEAPDG